MGNCRSELDPELDDSDDEGFAMRTEEPDESEYEEDEDEDDDDDDEGE